MRTRLPWLLLALSVALNVFFVGGAIWMKTRAGHGWMRPAERIEAAVKELHLDARQREALQDFLATMRVRAHQLREQNRPLIDAAWMELAKAAPDEAALGRAFDEGTANRRAFQLDTSRALHQFLRSLTDEQRAQVLEDVRKRPNAPFLRQVMP
jgi:Spy/CpxP family protein refolding chaperone